MKQFTMDNTTDFNQKQLDEMNVEFDKMMENIDPDDPHYVDFIKNYSDKIQNMQH